MALEDIRKCCALLEADKIGERKRGSEQLRHLLENAEIVHLLQKTKKGLTWNTVFHSTKSFWLKECDRLEKEERKKDAIASSTVKSSWILQKRTAVTLPKLIIKRAFKKGTAKISMDSILSFALMMLDRNRPYIVENFASHGVDIMKKYVLSSAEYFKDVSCSTWKDIIRQCIWVYENRVANITGESVFGVLESFIQNYKHCKGTQNISPADILSGVPEFMHTVLEDKTQLSQRSSQMAFLLLLSRLCKDFGMQWCQTLRSLGEKAISVFLPWWENSMTSKQKALLFFFDIQLQLHEADNESLLSSIEISESWITTLNQLFKLLRHQLDEIGRHYRLSGNQLAKELLFPPSELTNFAARLCVQVFQNHPVTGGIDVTQTTGLQSTHASNTNQTMKRHHVEATFESLIDFLKIENTGPENIPWLIILQKICVNHPEFIDSSHKESLLNLFLTMMQSSKDSTQLQEIMKCIGKLIVVPDKSVSSDCNKNTWSSIFDLTLRVVSGGQCTDQGLDLLKSMIENNKKDPDSSLFNYFIRGVFPVRSSSLSLLITLIRIKPFPQFAQNASTNYFLKGNGNPRMEILCWLLPVEIGSSPKKMAHCLESPQNLSTALFLLKLHDPLRNTEQTMKLESISHGMTMTDSPSRIVTDMENMIVDRCKEFLNQISSEITENGQESFELICRAMEFIVHFSQHTLNDKIITNFKKHELLNKILNEILAPKDQSKWNDVRFCLEKLQYLHQAASSCVQNKKSFVDACKSIYENLPSTTFETLMSIVKSNAVSQSETTLFPSIHDQNANEPMDVDFDDFDSPSTSTTLPRSLSDDSFQSETRNDNFSCIGLSSIQLSAQDECIVLSSSIVLLLSEVFKVCSIENEDEKATCVDTFGHFVTISENLNDLHQTAAIFCFLQKCSKSLYDKDNIEDCFLMISQISKKYADDSRIAKLCLNFIRDIIRENGKSLTEDHQMYVLRLTNPYKNRISKEMYGQDVTLALFETYMEMAKMDPKSVLSATPEETSSKLSVFYEMLKSPLYENRVNVGALVPLLLGTSTNGLPPSEQDKRFQNIYQNLIESLDYAGSRSSPLTADEREGRVATLLRTLVFVAVSSAYLEHKAVYTLFCSHKLFSIELPSIKKAIAKIASTKAFDVKEYRKRHLPSLISQWIQDKYDLKNFAFQLLDHNTFQEFCINEWQIISLVLCNENKLDIMKILAKELGTTSQELLKRNFSHHIASVIPYILEATKRMFKLLNSETNAGISHYKLIKSELGDECMIDLIEKKMGEIVLSMINMVHDPTSWFPGDLVFPGSKRFFEPDIIKQSIEHMHTIFFENENSMVSLLAEQRWPLHQVIHGLLANIASATEAHEYRWALAKIQVFINLIIPHFNENLHSMDSYVLMKMIHILTCYSLKMVAKSKLLTVKAYNILLQLVQHVVECAPEMLSPHLDTIFSRLTEFSNDSVIWDSAADILEVLLKCKTKTVREKASSLPCLPHDSLNERLKHLHTIHRDIIDMFHTGWSLKKYVEEFLRLSDEEISSRVLKDILELLELKKDQLDELSCEPDSMGYSLVHRFIHRLTNCISTSSCPQAKNICLDCLGALGPVNLNTDIFAIESEDLNQGALEHSFEHYIDVIMFIKRMTVSDNITLVEEADSTLRKIFATKVGKSIRKSFDKETNNQFLPFFCSPASKKRPREPEAEDFEELVCSQENWDVNQQYDCWVKNLTASLLKCGVGCEFFSSLLDLCNISEELCSKILPDVIHLSLEMDDKRRYRRARLSKVISVYINSQISQCLNSGSDGNHSTKHISMILQIINFLRLKAPSKTFTQRKLLTNWENNFWLDLDYCKVAEAASFCGAPFSTLMFAEISCEQIREKIPKEKDSKTRRERRQLQPLVRISSDPKSQVISGLLLKTYNTLGYSQGVEGCSGTYISNSCMVQGLQNRYRKNWMSSMAIGDAAGDRENIIENMRQTGLYHVLRNYLHSVPTETKNILEARAECCWRLAAWEDNDDQDVCAPFSKNSPMFGFHQSFASMLMEMKNHDTFGIHAAILASKTAALASFHENSKESTFTMYPLLRHLQMISEFEKLNECINMSRQELNVLKFENMSQYLERTTHNRNMEYEYLEPILSARASVLKIMLHSTKENVVQKLLFSTLLQKCELARITPISEEKIRQYEASIMDCKKVAAGESQLWRIQLEEAQLASGMNSQRDALSILEQLLLRINSSNVKSSDAPLIRSNVLRLSGQILMESRTKSPKDIVTDYLELSINISEKNFGEDDSQSKVNLYNSYYQLGSYGDLLYQEVHKYIMSDQWKQRKMQIENSKKELAKVLPLMAETNKNAPEFMALARKDRLLKKDIIRETNILKKRQVDAFFYLNLALENYLKCLSLFEDKEMIIFRVVALWFENLTSESVNKLINMYIQNIKSHKFLPLLYQLVARLTRIESSSKHHASFPPILVTLLERICEEHPHHGLPIVLMLANSHLDDEITNKKALPGRSGKSSRSKQVEEEPVEMEDRVEATKLLISKLKHTSIADHLVELEKVCISYVELANAQIGETNSTDSVSMSSQPLAKLKNLKHTAPLSRPIPIQPSAVYDVSPILKWQPYFCYVGGINSPKRLNIITQDGTNTMELLKGNDDIRQDAVLEQVFTVMNDLLKKDKEAKKHQLAIRTYVVTPFSQKSGIIQWCHDTVTIGSYLCDAHSKYFPENWSPLACRKKLASVKAQKADVLLKTFEEILDNFPPVFRFFFFEKFPEAQAWFDRRQSYTRSIATSSIAGYILGIGDRHVQNLLLDTRNAEIIHIDLGIAFENGKLLPTPELIPFRLTQDIIDGLGVCGIEGPLRSCMEITLKVMRQSKSVLTTIVEVLKYDPLHQWTLTPKQISKTQKVDQDDRIYQQGSSGVSMAERALIRVQQKLNGLQDGLVLSVPEQVSVLIQQATDQNNLSQVFNGWQPYL